MAKKVKKNEPKERYWYSYRAVMTELGISRRTLQRWMDDMDIQPQEFEDQLKVFLILPNLNRLREYKSFMRTRNGELITRFRRAIQHGDIRLLERVRKELN